MINSYVLSNLFSPFLTYISSIKKTERFKKEQQLSAFHVYL